MKNKREISRYKGLCLLALAIVAALLTGGCSGVLKNTPALNERAGVEEAWGIRIEGLRLSAAGYMLDFRYTVLDPGKAAPLLDRKLKPYVMDQKSSAKLIVPAPGKVGALRNTVEGSLPAEGRTYFVIFANPGRLVKAGDMVTVAIGDFRADMAVQ